jgi:apolipoprotein N-acyltransferase
MQLLHPPCLSVQLRSSSAPPLEFSGEVLRARRTNVRIVELTTTGITAIVSQVLIVATILI